MFLSVSLSKINKHIPRWGLKKKFKSWVVVFSRDTVRIQLITKSNFLGSAQINPGVHTFRSNAPPSVVPSNKCFLGFCLHIWWWVLGPCHTLPLYYHSCYCEGHTLEKHMNKSNEVLINISLLLKINKDKQVAFSASCILIYASTPCWTNFPSEMCCPCYL